MTKYFDTIREIVFYYIIVIALSSTIFYFAEDKSVAQSIWWAFATASTVGYGDIYPVTTIGRITGIFLMHAVPLIIVPLLTAQIASRLVGDNTFTNDEQEELKRQVRELHDMICKDRGD